MNTDKKILLSDFVEESAKYTNETALNNYINTLMVRSYTPFTEKSQYARRIIESTCQANASIDDTALKTYLQYPLYVMSIIEMYTSIDYNNGGKLNPFEAYDVLNETMLVGEILKAIPSSELDEFSQILALQMDDFMNNFMTTQAAIRRGMADINVLIDGFLSGLSPAIIDYIENTLKPHFKSAAKKKELDKLIQNITKALEPISNSDEEE